MGQNPGGRYFVAVFILLFASLTALYLGLTNGSKKTGWVGKVGTKTKDVVHVALNNGKPRRQKASNSTVLPSAQKLNETQVNEKATPTAVDEDEEIAAANEVKARYQEQMKFDASASDEDVAL